MSDRDLGARFASFASAPIAPLPGAAAAQERGAQRTRRTRAALSGAGALVVVVAVTAGAALAGGGGSALREDRLGPATAGPSPVLETGLNAALLDPEDVIAVRGGEWELRATDDLPFDPMPSGCRGDTTVFGDGGTGSALRFVDGTKDVIGHGVRAYATTAEAAAPFGRLIDSIEACDGMSVTLVGGLPGSGPDRVYGSYVQANFFVGFTVERVDSFLTGVALRTDRPRRGAEDGVYEQLPALADAAAAEVRELVPAAPAAAASSVPPEAADWRQPDPGLLRAQDVAAAGLSTWDVQWLTDPEGGATGCMRAAMGDPPRYPEVGAWGRMVRVADDALAQQSTARYPDAALASKAFASHVAALRACPTEEIVDWPGEPRVVLSVATHEVVEESPDRLLVRTTYACDTCDGRATYLAVLRVGAWLTVLNLPAEGDAADPAGLARVLMDTAATRLAAVGSA